MFQSTDACWPWLSSGFRSILLRLIASKIRDVYLVDRGEEDLVQNAMTNKRSVRQRIVEVPVGDPCVIVWSYYLYHLPSASDHTCPLDAQPP